MVSALRISIGRRIGADECFEYWNAAIYVQGHRDEMPEESSVALSVLWVTDDACTFETLGVAQG
ncbi:hypothetical protein BGE01nite_00670 [Brevifollis gellanilyticus]|uniref:Uncharacterized protein n=1 Tax=Brevifollis gellanilyticus TaxID=748831 RepID=A0A512M201_9BACT|nr:hypothetical protein BGE01nite_00670 [Brevifollis gellanilyticus]